MQAKQSSYLGNGVRQYIRCGFKPTVILLKADTTQPAVFYTSGMWCGRTNVLSTGASFNFGISVDDTGFYVGSAVQVNSSAVQHHFIALGEDYAGGFEHQSWAGNGISGHKITLKEDKIPLASIVKRDGPRQAAFKIAGVSTTFMNGDVATDCISLSQGYATLTNANEVNEYDSAGGLGEGIDGAFFYQNENCRAISWVGDGQPGRKINTGIKSPTAVLTSIGQTGVSSRLLFLSAGNKTSPVTTASANQEGEAYLQGSDIVIGNSQNVLNAAGIVYGAVVFSENISGVVKAPFISVKNRQAVYLPAGVIASYIDCGTSDATLLINGAITYEFYGAVMPNPTPANNAEVSTLISRGVGPYGTAGGYSWGLTYGQPNDGLFGWSTQIAPQASPMLSLAPPLDTSNWRTGIVPKYGQMQHIVSSQDASGNCFLMVDGDIVKQRSNPAATIASVSGHKTTIGARISTATPVRNTRMVIREIAIYSKALSVQEAQSRYIRAVFGSTDVADVSSSRAAWWNADNASGVLLPDSVNSANNGTINNGVLISI